MPQIRRGLQRPVFSRVIEVRDLRRVIRIAIIYQVPAAGVIAMTQGKRATIAPSNKNFAYPKRRRLRRGFDHLNAWPISMATRSSTSRSSFVNAFSFSLSAVITPTTRSDLLMIGTTISDFVL